ncbi:hypothetical protein ACIOG9_27115, partial [Streptomyces sp. NPDC088178]
MYRQHRHRRFTLARKIADPHHRGMDNPAEDVLAGVGPRLRALRRAR